MLNPRPRTVALRRLLALATVSFAASAALAATESRTVDEFDAIELAGPVRLVVRQAERHAVQVDADPDTMARLETRVDRRRERSVLVIRLRDDNGFRRSGAVTVGVDVVRLLALSASGSGSVDVGALKTPSLRLSIAGSGDAKLSGLATEQLEASIAGSGDVRADGRARQVSLSIAGSGDADLRGLGADEVKVSIAGSGDAEVTAERSLKVSIAGSGDVRYAGAATEVKSSVAGSGSVRRR